MAESVLKLQLFACRTPLIIIDYHLIIIYLDLPHSEDPQSRTIKVEALH